jgi:serine/threonine-protein kinase
MDAAADRLRWAERYTRSPSELPVLERDISEAVAAQLGAAARPTGASETMSDPRTIRAVDPLTYGIYLRGRDAMLSRDPAGLRRAVVLFQQALLRDSTFALGWAGLADAWRLAGGLGYIPETFCFDSAPAAARRALALDDQLSEGHSALAGTLTDAADWTHAEAEFRRAIALEPGNALAHQWYAAMLITLDRKEEALHEARRGLELDPLAQAARGLEGGIEGYMGIHRPNAARNAAHGPPRSALVDPNHPGTRAWRAVTFARLGRCVDAYAESDTAQMLAPDVAMVLIARAGVHQLCGHHAEAMATIDRAKTHPEVYLAGVYMAEFYTAIGERDSAFAWLYRTHYGMANRMDLRMAPALNPLRGDPRFRALLQREHM